MGYFRCRLFPIVSNCPPFVSRPIVIPFEGIALSPTVRLTPTPNILFIVRHSLTTAYPTIRSYRISALEYATTRKKSEVVYSGVSVTIPTATTNLVSLLKTLTPSSGTLAPFFDTVNNKMVVFNENKTLFFKLSIVGTWPSGTANRSMQLTFSGSVPDTLVSSRNAATDDHEKPCSVHASCGAVC